jgi:peroxiredoxin
MELQRHETEQWVDERMAALNRPRDWSPDTGGGWARLSRRRRQASQLRGRKLAVTVGGAALVGGLVMAFPPTRALAYRCVDACVAGSSQVTRLIWHRDKMPQRRLAPDFTLNDATGLPMRLSSLQGQVVLLNFWATWCKPCTIEIPWFVEFQRKYGERGLVVLGVSLDEDGWKSVRPFLERQQVNYRIMIGGETVTSLFGGIDSLPATLLIDRQGRIASTHAGLATREAYEAEIQATLAE